MKKTDTIEDLMGVNRITEYLRKVIVDSFEQAKFRGSATIDLEDIFYSIIKEKKNIASRVLERMGVDLDNTVSAIRKKYTLLNKKTTNPIPSELMRQALSDAFLISSDLGHVYVGTEHVLLALLQFNDEDFVKDLAQAGIDINSVKAMLLSFGSYQPGLFSQMGDTEQREPENKNALGIYARDMNKLAEEGRYMKVWGREKELDRLIHILSRKTKNNPILVGESGVGKTAIVEALVQRILKKDVPHSFRNKTIIQLDLASIIAGSKIRGDVEERILAIVNEVSEDRNKVLFIDEIHMIVGAGTSGQGSMDVANILKPYLTSGDLQLIGATTFDEYQKYFEDDEALSRRFQPITVNEISKEDALQVLKSLKKDFENFHDVMISEDALDEIIMLSDRYITNRYFPDKAIDILDEAAAAAKIKKERSVVSSKDIKDDINEIRKKKDKALDNADMDLAVKLLREERELSDKLNKNEKRSRSRSKKFAVTQEDVRSVISKWSGIPVNTLSRQDVNSIRKIGDRLKKRIIGQDNALETVVGALKRSRIGISDKRRPMSTFLFLGPTGVGKTELAKTIAREVYGNEDALIQIDMSEFMEQHSVSKLIGSPPGYVGFQEGGQLTERVKRNPYSIVLFDEIEKAHPELLNILLQIMEEGSLQDSKGRKVNFRNTIIIMTSNIGAAEISKDTVLGFNLEIEKKNELEDAYETMKSKLTEELKDNLPPEFINRIDAVVIFKTLNEEDIKKIVKINIDDLNKRLSEKKIHVDVNAAVVDYLTKEGYSEEYGARNIRRLIQNEIENPLAELILDEGLVGNQELVEVKAGREIGKNRDKVILEIK